MDMNRLTTKAQEALGAAQNLALTRGHQEVDAEHLALALLRQQEGLVPGVPHSNPENNGQRLRH